MIIGFIAIELILFIISIKLIADVTQQFKLNRIYVRLFVIPLFFFIFGFTLRISGYQFLIDLGFLFTEFTTLFVSILFVIFLCLGQIKYWKISND